MKCPSCNWEPRHRLLHKPCPACGHVWWDTESYVRELATGCDSIATVLDVGCGDKGVIAQAYWDEIAITKGYACDRHTIKPLPEPWTALLMDAENLVEHLGEKSVDFTTHCGLLEHLDYDKALSILHVLERVTRKCIFFTCSALLREADYKVVRDGNQYHRYISWWSANAFEQLGYHVDRERMANGQTFHEEIIGWVKLDELTKDWEIRRKSCLRQIKKRQCSAIGCKDNPIFWDVKTKSCYCSKHTLVHYPNITGPLAQS